LPQKPKKTEPWANNRWEKVQHRINKKPQFCIVEKKVYLQNSRLLRQPIGKIVKLNSSSGNSNGKLFVKKLSRNQQILVNGFGPKFHHVPQIYPCLLQATPSMHFLNQGLFGSHENAVLEARPLKSKTELEHQPTCNSSTQCKKHRRQKPKKIQ